MLATFQMLPTSQLTDSECSAHCLTQSVQQTSIASDTMEVGHDQPAATSGQCETSPMMCSSQIDHLDISVSSIEEFIEPLNSVDLTNQLI